jgi:hypothetical protein
MLAGNISRYDCVVLARKRDLSLLEETKDSLTAFVKQLIKYYPCRGCGAGSSGLGPCGAGGGGLGGR